MVAIMPDMLSEIQLLQEGKEMPGRACSFHAGVKKLNICTRPAFFKCPFLSATWRMSEWMSWVPLFEGSRWALYLEFYIETYNVVCFTAPPTHGIRRHTKHLEEQLESDDRMRNSAQCVSQSVTALCLCSAFFLFFSVEERIVQRFTRDTCLERFALMSSGVHKNCTDVFPTSD